MACFLNPAVLIGGLVFCSGQFLAGVSNLNVQAGIASLTPWQHHKHESSQQSRPAVARRSRLRLHLKCRPPAAQQQAPQIETHATFFPMHHTLACLQHEHAIVSKDAENSKIMA